MTATSANTNELAYNIYDAPERVSGGVNVAGGVVAIPGFVDAHRRARARDDVDREDAKPIATPTHRLPKHF